MPNIASLLKAEIARIARKEIRSEVESLKKAAGAYRKEIAALKRRSQALEQQLRRADKVSPKTEASADEPQGKAVRFSAKGLLAQRTRLGLSAEALGLLVGASGQSVYNWEAGKVRPRARHLEAIAALKTLGKKQAREIAAARA